MMPPDVVVLPPFPGPMLAPPPGTVPTGLIGNCAAPWCVDCAGLRPKIPPLEPIGTVPLELAVELVLGFALPTAETVLLLLLLFPAGPPGPLPAAAWAYGVGIELEIMAAILLGIMPGILLLVTAGPALLALSPADVNG